MSCCVVAVLGLVGSVIRVVYGLLNPTITCCVVAVVGLVGSVIPV